VVDNEEEGCKNLDQRQFCCPHHQTFLSFTNCLKHYALLTLLERHLKHSSLQTIQNLIVCIPRRIYLFAQFVDFLNAVAFFGDSGEDILAELVSDWQQLIGYDGQLIETLQAID
jgi:hypothetical protein